MKVQCSVEIVGLENDEGHDVDGVLVTCSRCEHSEESYGTSEASVRRCLALLRENCPRNERNFYVADEGKVVE
jgi:hypothetical protein